MQETAAGLTVRGAALTLEIGRDPWRLAFRDETGRVVCRENPFDVDGLNRLFIRPLGFVRDAGGAVTQITESFHLRPDEHLFGLGEKFTPLDKTGQRIVSWTLDALGAASERAYKNVPLLISTRGYGLFLNTGRRITYELGTESCETYTVAIDGPILDAFLIYGPTPAEILERYTRLTGRAPVPPKWSFGLWLSGSGVHRDEPAIRRMVEQLAEHDIPCDVIHVDPWWMRWRKYADFRWDRDSVPRSRALHCRPASAGAAAQPLAAFVHLGGERSVRGRRAARLFRPAARWPDLRDRLRAIALDLALRRDARGVAGNLLERRAWRSST